APSSPVLRPAPAPISMYSSRRTRAKMGIPKVLHVYVLVGAVEVVVQSSAGVDGLQLFIQRLLADGLPREGARQQDCRRHRYRANGRGDFMLSCFEWHYCLLLSFFFEKQRYAPASVTVTMYTPTALPFALEVALTVRVPPAVSSAP